MAQKDRDPRAPERRWLTLDAAAYRAGYETETLRKKFAAGDHPPGARKVGGRWRVWSDDLDAWLDEMPTDAATPA